MRITGGIFKGREIFAPKGSATRPILERVRKSLFDLLSSHINFSDFFLDLFAGSGVLGIEYMSRGGKGGIFVDKSWRAVETIRSNLRRLGISEGIKVYRMDVERFIRSNKLGSGPFEVIFVDPPFDRGFQPFIMNALRMLDDKGVMVVRIFKKSNVPDGINIIDNRVYGESRILILGKD